MYVQVSYLIVDEMHHEHPELIKDQYWEEVFPTELPHTVASQPFKDKVPQPSTANIAVSNVDAEYINPQSVKVEDGLVCIIFIYIISFRSCDEFILIEQ